MKWSGKAGCRGDNPAGGKGSAEKEYKRYIWREAASWAAIAAVLLLTGCGDDISLTVPAINPEELAAAISREQEGTEGQEGQEGSEGQERPKGEEGAEGQERPEGQEGSEGQEGPEVTKAGGAHGPAASGENMTETSEEDPRVVAITISAAGDVTLGNHKEQDYSYSFRQAYDNAEDKGYFFENVLDIFDSDDMTIVNLEGPLTLSENFREGQIYSIKGNPDYASLLNLGSIEAVSMGNNHRLDYGEEGSRDTVDAVEEAGVVYAYDDNVGIYETKGIQIGFVSVNEVYWGAGVEKTMQNGIEKLKEEDADLILACCHWGTERENYPEDYQKSLGRKCIDWGADLVIGHHPHVLQGVDKYQGKYIIYSLGNFCFGANRNPPDKDTMIFQQTFTFRDGVKEEDEDVRIIPCSVSSVTTRNDFRPTPAQGEDARRIIDRVNEYSKDFGVAFDEDGRVIRE